MLGSCRIFGGSVRHSSSDASVTSLMGTTEMVRLRPFFFFVFLRRGVPASLPAAPADVPAASTFAGLAGDETADDESVDEVLRRRLKTFRLFR